MLSCHVQKCAKVQSCTLVTCCLLHQGSSALEALATAHAMWALLMAEQMRFAYNSASQQTPSNSEAECLSEPKTRPASKGTTHAGKQQSPSAEEDTAVSGDKEGAWQPCLQHAQEAVHAWQRCLTDAVPESHVSCEAVVDANLLPQLMMELLYMAGLHGEA